MVSGCESVCRFDVILGFVLKWVVSDVIDFGFICCCKIVVIIWLVFGCEFR